MSVLPTIIQGGMGAGVSSWRWARAVSQLGQHGVVSGTALDFIFARPLQDGDPDGHMRRGSFGFLVEPLANQCSALVRNPVIANALIAHPEGRAAYESGDQMTVQVLDWRGVVQKNSTLA